MKSKIIAIQGDSLNKLNPKTDTTIFLAVEAQKKNYKIFYYEPTNLYIKANNVYAEGFFVKFNYLKNNYYELNILIGEKNDKKNNKKKCDEDRGCCYWVISLPINTNSINRIS